MKVFAYADETEFTLAETSSSVIGSGIIITEKEVSQSVINEAMKALGDDWEKDKSDLETLKNGYFHASSDSKNAHSHLCKAINNNLEGFFKYSYHTQSLTEKRFSKEALNKRTLELVAIPLIDYHFEEITFIIEGRNQFQQSQCELWIENLYRILEITLYTQTSFITYFPKIEVIIADKRNPGLQIIDFILWAQNRTQKNDNRWIDRINTVARTSHQTDEEPSFGGSCYINRWVNFPLDRLNYPFQKVQEADNNDVIRCYLLMEQTVLILNKNLDKLPPSIKHHKFTISNTAEKLLRAGKSLTEEVIEYAASTYLRIFDTLPIYNSVNEGDKATWEILLFSKHVAALLRRKGFGNNTRTIHHISYWKYHNDESDYLDGLWPIQKFIESTIESFHD